MAVFREDPYSALNFEVVINGVTPDGRDVRGAFAEVSGLDIEVEPIEYRNGSEPSRTRKLPGLPKFSNIMLKRGVTGDLTLWAWMKTVQDGNPQRADGTITLLNEAREAVMRWKFRRGWPCRITGPTLTANRSEIAIETLEICHEGLEVE
jgi:phage tail-like protein